MKKNCFNCRCYDFEDGDHGYIENSHWCCKRDIDLRNNEEYLEKGKRCFESKKERMYKWKLKK